MTPKQTKVILRQKVVSHPARVYLYVDIASKSKWEKKMERKRKIKNSASRIYQPSLCFYTFEVVRKVNISFYIPQSSFNFITFNYVIFFLPLILVSLSQNILVA